MSDWFGGSERAASTAAHATIKAARIQQAMYEQTRQDMMPWLKAGTNALGQLTQKVEAGPGEYEKSPYYDFLMGEGTGGLERGAAAKGKQFSGQQAKALTEYGQNLASTDYDNWLNRWYQSLTPLQSLAQIGQTTGSQLGAIGGQSAQTQGNFLNQAGQAKAAGQLGTANTIGNWLNWGLNQLLTGTGGGTGGGAGIPSAFGIGGF